MKAPQPVHITDWSAEPLIVTHERVAEIWGRSKRSIERMVRLRMMRPMPVQFRPMRWSRADLEAHWRGEFSSAQKARKAS